MKWFVLKVGRLLAIVKLNCAIKDADFDFIFNLQETG